MIDQFRGAYRWLSNFSPAEVVLDGVTYPTVEHAYQAAKTLDHSIRERIRQADTPGRAKKAGRGLRSCRPDWGQVRLEIMEHLLWQKFTRAPWRAQLLATGKRELVEGNWWGDQFWGVCEGRGENHLGQLLMRIRQELRQ